MIARRYTYERSRSLAVAPAGGRFVLGTEWSLRAYDRAGTPLWRRDVPGVVWAVTISGDGRLVVAAYGDGTIRWHRLEDGKEVLALMPLADAAKNWVAWTPEGFYAASSGADKILRWHINHGFDRAPETVPVSRFPGFERPGLIAHALDEGGLERALGPGDLARLRAMVANTTGFAPGPRLRLLTIGVDLGGLRYAAADAEAVTRTLSAAKGSYYADVLSWPLTNGKATRLELFQSFRALRAGNDQDLTVVLFSGHGRVLDGELYLSLAGADPADDDAFKANAVRVAEVARELAILGEKGRVLVLLDACHSGAATGQEAGGGIDADALRKALAKANISVLTSSQAGETSKEDPQWGHGAFVKALLEALKGPKADTDHNGLLSVSELAAYVGKRVPELTLGRQHPVLEKRFDGDVFPVGGS